MGAVVRVTDDTFRAEVLESELPVLVEYWAPWCGPCRRVAPLLDEIAADSRAWLRVRKVNVDQEPELALDADVHSIPTLILYRAGRPEARITGARHKQALIDGLRLRPDAPVAA